MAVQVSDICDRCGRATPVHMSNDEIVADTEKRKKVLEACSKIQEFFDGLDPTHLPSLLVIHKGDEGKISVKSIISLCDPKDEGKRSCKKRVAELVSDLFPTPADKRAPRKPREKKPDSKGKK